MDETDFRILARLQREPLASMSEIGREVALTPNAVRARLAKLRAQRVWWGVVALPNPRILGRVARLAIYARVPEGVRPERTLEVDDVLGYSTNHDGQLAVTYYARTPDEPPPPALDALLGGPPPRTLLRREPELKPKGAALSRADWRLVDAVLEDARQTGRALAKATSLGERAAARHYARLREGGHLMVMSVVLPNAAEGVVLFHLWAHGPGTKDERAVCRAIGWSSVEERLEEPGGVFVFCRAESFGDALLARDRVAKLPGVDHVEIVLQGEAGVAWPRIRALCRAARDGAR